MKRLARRFLLTLGTAALGCVAGGCAGSAPEAQQPAMSQSQVDSKIKKIQDDPNLPAGAKEQRINQIKTYQAQHSK